MALAKVYTQVYGQIRGFFQKIQEGQAPSSFTQQHLKDIGFASTNHRTFIPILKALGFLSPNGAPTNRYHAYRNRAQARRVMSEALKEAYTDLFTIKSHPKKSDEGLIVGKFKSTHNVTDGVAGRMAKTFFSLLELADLDHVSGPRKDVEETSNSAPKADVVASKAATRPHADGVPPGLHYNIQIHLPATKDIEVYNAIFKSLRGHLLD